MDTHKRSLGFISLAFLFITCSSAEFLIQQVTQGRGTETNGSYSLQANLGETTSEIRDQRPSSKIVTIAGYSVIKGRSEPYESSVFEAGGYKWRLVLYVTGNKNDSGAGYISLYARIEETESLPNGWIVSVDLKLFVHDHQYDRWLTVRDGKVKQYHSRKRERGFGQLISLSSFEYPANMYIVNDTCSFGAEILVVKQAKLQEKVTFISNPPNNVFTWKILRFTTKEDKIYNSAEFLVGDRYWRLEVKNSGDGFWKPRTLAIKLYAQGFKPNAVETTTWGAVNMRLRHQRGSNHKKVYSAAWYPIQPGYGVGEDIISYRDLPGYLVNDSLVFEAEMVMVSVTNIVPT